MGSLSPSRSNASRAGSQISAMFPKLPRVDSPEVSSLDDKPLLYRVSLKSTHNTPDLKPRTIPSRQQSIATEGDSPLQAKSVRFAPGVKFVSQENRTVPLRRLPKVIPYKTGVIRGSPTGQTHHQLPNINADKSPVIDARFLGDAARALPINSRGGPKAVIQSTVNATERQLNKLRKRRQQIRWREAAASENPSKPYVNMKRFSVKGHHIENTGTSGNAIYGSSTPLLPRRTTPNLYSNTITEKRTFAGGMILQLLTRDPNELAVSGNCISGNGSHSVNGHFVNFGGSSPKPKKKWSSASRVSQFHEKFPDMYRVPANMSSASRRDVWNVTNRTGANAFMHMVSPRSVTNGQPLDVSFKAHKLQDRV